MGLLLYSVLDTVGKTNKSNVTECGLTWCTRTLIETDAHHHSGQNVVDSRPP